MHPEAVKDASSRHMRDFTRLSNHTVAAMHPTLKFRAIRSIVMDIERRFPDPKRDEIPLDESLIADEIEILMKISETIRPSDEYQEIIDRVTRKTIYNLMSRTDQKSLILEWNSVPYDRRHDVMMALHQIMMTHSQDEFFYAPCLSKSLTPVKITSFFESAAKHTKVGHPLGISYGYVDTDSKDSEDHEMYYNQHPDAGFDNVLEAIDTGCHETAHVIESGLTRLFNVAPDQVPSQLQKDAQNFLAQRASSGYIPSRISTPYQYQCNEFVAFKTGCTAQKTLSLLMQ